MLGTVAAVNVIVVVTIVVVVAASVVVVVMVVERVAVFGKSSTCMTVHM